MLKINKINWFGVLLGFLFIVILFTRTLPYLIYGPFGFGYDLGIYKKTFESIISFKDILSSEIYFLPAFLAYLLNIVHISTDLLLYFAYILFSLITGFSLYKLTKELFSKETALISVFIFAISYIQIFGSNFYLYKAFLGAGMMLLAFYFYSKKSYWFYIFAFLLAITQLPQFLLLIIGVTLAGLLSWKKDIKFNLIGVLSLITGFIFLSIFTPHHLINGWNIVWESILGSGINDNHHTGYFMEISTFFKKEAWIFIFGLVGLAYSYKNKKARALQIALVSVILIVVLKLFFFKRYILEMDLLLIPFTANAFYILFEKFKNKLYIKKITIGLIIVVSIFTCIYWVKASRPSLSLAEVNAISIIKNRKDDNLVLTTHSKYGPWVYGFSGKLTSIPGMHNSIWTFGEWMGYKRGNTNERSKLLIETANKHGDFYLYQGVIERKDVVHVGVDIIELYNKNDTKVYLIKKSI